MGQRRRWEHHRASSTVRLILLSPTIGLPTPDLERSPKRQGPREGHALSGSIDGVQFGPKFTRDRVLRQLQRLCEPLRTSDANNRGGDAGIAQRELQGRRRKGNAMALAGLLHLHGSSKQLGRRLAIHIAWVGVWSFRQDTAPIGGSVHSCNSPASAYIPEWLGLPVKQREAVMRNSCFKDAGLDKADHHIDRSTSDTQVRNQALFFALLQYFDGTTRLHCLFKGNVLGVVEIEEL